MKVFSNTLSKDSSRHKSEVTGKWPVSLDKFITFCYLIFYFYLIHNYDGKYTFGTTYLVVHQASGDVGNLCCFINSYQLAIQTAEIEVDQESWPLQFRAKHFWNLFCSEKICIRYATMYCVYLFSYWSTVILLVLQVKCMGIAIALLESHGNWLIHSVYWIK